MAGAPPWGVLDALQAEAKNDFFITFNADGEAIEMVATDVSRTYKLRADLKAFDAARREAALDPSWNALFHSIRGALQTGDVEVQVPDALTARAALRITFAVASFRMRIEFPLERVDELSSRDLLRSILRRAFRRSSSHGQTDAAAAQAAPARPSAAEQAAPAAAASGASAQGSLTLQQLREKNKYKAQLDEPCAAASAASSSAADVHGTSASAGASAASPPPPDAPSRPAAEPAAAPAAPAAAPPAKRKATGPLVKGAGRRRGAGARLDLDGDDDS
eukprot:tig00000158_g10174.t1